MSKARVIRKTGGPTAAAGETRATTANAIAGVSAATETGSAQTIGDASSYRSAPIVAARGRVICGSQQPSARECQQVAREIASVKRRAHDMLDQFVGVRIFGQVGAEQFGVSENHRQTPYF